MNNTISKQMKQNLLDAIHDMSLHQALFIKEPGVDFSPFYI